MRKGKIIRIITAVSLSFSLLAAGGIYASAQTPETASAVPREFKDVAAAMVNKGVDYDLSSLDLKTLPAYMEESLGFSELSAEKQPKSVTDLNVEDLYSFTTYNEDDTLTLYMFSEPVKFVDKETSAIRFIDNTIKVSAENSPPVLSGQLNAVGSELYTAKSYTNTANFFKVNMPSSVNQGISLSYDNKKFTLSPATASLSTATLKTAAHRGMREQVVEYRNALGDGIHLQYVPINNGVKENIILDRYPGRNTFNFIFDAGGYYPVYTEGESIPFADPTTDEIALILGQADARDSYTGDETDGHFTLYNSLKVESLGNGKYTLTVTIDNDFLTDPDTVYPVVIDPSYTLPSTSFRDTTVYENKPTSSAYYTSAYLIVGDHGSAYGEGIAFVQTKKMTDLVNNGIVPEKVTYASYRVYEGSGKTNSSLIQLKGTTANWDQTTITYNNKPTLENGSYSQNVVDHSGWYTFDVTTQVRNFLAWADDYSGYSQTRGFALKAYDPTASSKHFCSGEYTGSTKPSIIINYVSSAHDISATYNSDGYLPLQAWGQLINNDARLFTFKINSTGTYVIETMASGYFTNGQTTDTMIELFNQNYTRMLINDTPTNSSSDYARIQYAFSPGTYHILISDADDSDGAAGTADSIGRVDGLKCYVIIEKLGHLSASYNYYVDTLRNFYTMGDLDQSFNCMNYAFNDYNTDYSTCSWSQFEGYMADKQYEYADTYSNNCIVIYGNEVTVYHVAKVVNGVVSAKFGLLMELVMHSHYDSYLSSNYSIIRFCTRS